VPLEAIKIDTLVKSRHLRHIIAEAAFTDDFNAICNKNQKLSRKSFVDALLRMVA